MTRDNLPWPNCDSDGKADNKRQALINTDMRRFKIQMGDMGPPPPSWQGLFFTSISPEIWFVTFSKIWNLFACAVLVFLFLWLRKRCDLAQKMVWLVNKSHRANQIAWITSDFKVDVIKGKNQPHWLESKCAKKNAPLPEIKGDFDILL